MERLAALLAVPDCRPLVDWVLANDALLSSLSKGLDQKHALLRQVLVVAQEVLEVVLNLRSILLIPVFSAFYHLKLLDVWPLRLFITDELGCGAQISIVALPFILVIFLAPSLQGRGRVCKVLLGGKLDFLLMKQVFILGLISLLSLLTLFKVFTHICTASLVATPASLAASVLALVALIISFVVFGLLVRFILVPVTLPLVLTSTTPLALATVDLS